MVEIKRYVPRLSRKAELGLGGALLLLLGAAGGAGAVAAARPGIEMAPRVAVPIASLAQREGVVTVKGRVTDIYGDRFVIADTSGRTMVAAGRAGRTLSAGEPVLVQGRYDEGQLRASFLVDSGGRVEAVGPRGPHGHGGPEGPGGPGHGPGHDGPPPPPPPGGPGTAGCAPGSGSGVVPIPPRADEPITPAAAVPPR